MVKLKQKIKSLGGSSGSGIFDSNVERLPRINIKGKLACCGIEWTNSPIDRHPGRRGPTAHRDGFPQTGS